MNSKTLLTAILIIISTIVSAQTYDPFKPDPGKPKVIKGMKLVWNDEFNNTGKPDSAFWRYEMGFVRNQEIHWYQPDNANCTNSVLLIEGRREQFSNPHNI